MRRVGQPFNPAVFPAYSQSQYLIHLTVVFPTFFSSAIPSVLPSYYETYIPVSALIQRCFRHFNHRSFEYTIVLPSCCQPLINVIPTLSPSIMPSRYGRPSCHLCFVLLFPSTMLVWPSWSATYIPHLFQALIQRCSDIDHPFELCNRFYRVIVNR